MLDFLKNLGKRSIFAAVVLLVIFLAMPGIATVFFVGAAVGVVAGNFYDPLEKMAEKFIAERLRG